MALTRKMLTAMGLEAEKIDQIIEAHAETVNGLKAEIEQQKEKADKLDGVQKELDDLKKATEGKDYDALKKEYDEYKEGIQKKETQAKKEKAYRAAIKDLNLSEEGIEKAVKYADWAGVDIDEEGNLKDANAHLKSVREEWGSFITQKGQKGAETTTPPENNGGGHQPSRAALVAKKHYEALYGREGEEK